MFVSKQLLYSLVVKMSTNVTSGALDFIYFQLDFKTSRREQTEIDTDSKGRELAARLPKLPVRIMSTYFTESSRQEERRK